MQIDTIWKEKQTTKAEPKQAENDEGCTSEKKACLSSREKRDEIIAIIKDDPHISQQKIAEILDISVDGVRYHMRKLKEGKVLYRVGPDKGGEWVLNSVE